MIANRRGASTLDALGVVAVSFVIAAITLSVGGKVVGDMQTAGSGNETAGYQTAEWLIYQNASNAVGNIGTNLPLIGTIVALAFVISFVLLLRA